MDYENISFPCTETCMIMTPLHTNSRGNVHGGEIMKIMDNTAGITAYKHAKGQVVTARVDEIEFHRTIHIGDVVTCIAQLAYVGNSSMQIMVEMVVNRIVEGSQPERAITAFFTFVHLKDGKPAKVPPLVVKTMEDAELYRLGEEKYREIRAKLDKRKDKPHSSCGVPDC